jgi:glucokinase
VAGGHITEAARSGDPVALEAFAVAGDWLGRGMADLAAVLDPEAFVIGGGVSEAGDLLFVPTRASFLNHLTGRQHRDPPELRLAALGNDAGIVGAADLARE